MAEKLFFTDLAASSNPPRAIPATCSITTVASASLVDGEIFQLWDGNKMWTFEFDKNGVIVGETPGRIRIDVSAVLTADQVRDAIIAAINSTGGLLLASSGGAATVSVRNKQPGTHGNGNNLETVVNAGFVLTNMTGGVMDGIALEDLRAYKDHLIWLFASSGAAIVISARFRLWGFREQIYQADTRATPDNERGWTLAPLTDRAATPADGNRGYLNAGTAIGEDAPADRVHYTERVADLAAFSHLYLQMTDMAVAATFTAGIVGDPPWQRR